jgi:hypothetical protein
VSGTSFEIGVRLKAARPGSSLSDSVQAVKASPFQSPKPGAMPSSRFLPPRATRRTTRLSVQLRSSDFQVASASTFVFAKRALYSRSIFVFTVDSSVDDVFSMAT